jgi:hypothetical protein
MKRNNMILILSFLNCILKGQVRGQGKVRQTINKLLAVWRILPSRLYSNALGRD